MDLGISQKEAARRIGADQWTVINWEKGRTEPAVRFVPGVLAFLGFDPRCPGTTFGERLRRARHGQGLSQRRLAQILRVDEGTVRTWETGRHRPSARLFSRLVSLLDIATPDCVPRQKGSLDTARFAGRTLSPVE